MRRTSARLPGPLDRRRVLGTGAAATLLALGSMSPRAWALASGLPLSVSLADELKSALSKGQPLVVMVSLEGCPFCKVASQNFLAPMQAQEGLPVVQVDWRSGRAIKDFKGATATHDQMARAWGTRVAPTVMFFGKGGTEVAERMVGAYLPDFYGAYLDDRLQQARRVVRGS